jgi:hypothetical protein
MPKPKKRLSKKAKEALKILEDSKLLETSKTTISRVDDNFKQSDAAGKTATAHKIRPSKKRGG